MAVGIVVVGFRNDDMMVGVVRYVEQAADPGEPWGDTTHAVHFIGGLIDDFTRRGEFQYLAE